MVVCARDTGEFLLLGAVGLPRENIFLARPVFPVAIECYLPPGDQTGRNLFALSEDTGLPVGITL